MKQLSLVTVTFFLGFFIGFSLSIVQPNILGLAVSYPVNVVSVQPVFSPGSQSEAESLIRSAHNSIELEVYTFTSNVLLDELGGASQRGVNVNVILEHSISSNIETAKKLAARGIKVKWGSKSFSLTHAKFLIIDNETVFVGSNNWSYHSFNLNREAGVILKSREISNKFTAIFYSDWKEGAYAS